MATLTRREVILGSAGITFCFPLPVNGFINPAIAQTADQDKSLSAWVRISVDSTVTIMSPASELGQGSMTAVPMMFAEELDVDWDQVAIEFSPADDEIFKNPWPYSFGVMMTLASTAVSGYHDSVRLYGAQARKILINAAADRWGVPATDLATEPSVVIHEKSGRRLSYGEIASFIEVPAQLPEISKMDLKSADQFHIMGKNIPRYDIPQKVTGGTIYSIDVNLPGMVYATVNRAPVRGASPVEVENESAIRALPNVIEVISLSDAVAVVARTYEAAFKAEKELEIKWSEVPKLAGYNQDKGLEDHMKAARDLNVKAKPLQKKGDISQALQQSAKVYEAEYRTEYHYHAQMEPLNSVAQVKDGGKSVDVWAGTQTPTHCTRSVAAALGIPVENVQLHRTMLGGAFGRRAAQDHDFVVDSVLLSQKVGKPVKVIWSRETDVKAGRFKPITAHYMRAGEDAHGS